MQFAKVRRLPACLFTFCTAIALTAGVCTSTASADPAATQWAQLRQCESSGNYAINTGNGYYGAYQFDQATWSSVGGSGRPDQASPAEQDYRALYLYRMRGWQPWTCAQGFTSDSDAASGRVPTYAESAYIGGGSATPVAQHVFEAATAGGPVTADGFFGDTGDQDLACRWVGGGTATVGTFRDGVWSLSSSIGSATPAVSFAFGDPGDQPICGDWNGDGIDTVGVYRSGVVYLRNSNSSGPADDSFYFGAPGDVAVTGDWNGDGYTTLGVHRGGLFYLTDSNLYPRTVGVVSFGNPGDLPVTGDWNGDGYTTLGVVRNGWWYLANSNLAPRADLSFGLGNTGDNPVAGSWTGGRTTGVGVIRN